MPYERVVMVLFAHAGYVVVAFAAVFMWWVGRRALGVWLAVLCVIATAALGSLAWADGLAHLGKRLVLGPCNPYYAACNGEHEGWTGPTTSDGRWLATWDAMKCGPPPGGSAHPLMPWLGNPASGSFCR